MSFRNVALLIGLSIFTTDLPAADWARFRGPNGSGVSTDQLPVKWSDDENVKWKADLPGPGLSSPIIIGDRVVVTCWTGYADGSESEGTLEDLKRNVLCLSRDTGDVIWRHIEDPVLPEDSFRGMFAENGYASHTPATDGERVYVFFGKTGVLALDLGDGRKLWQRSVGENRERKGWGSASSPIVSGKNVIVPAFIEGDALVAINGASGEIAWKQEVPGYTSNWSTPILVEANDRTDLVLTVPGEVWGLNPDSGKLRWYCEIPGSDDARSSVIAVDDLVVAMAGGRGASTSIAVKAGGKGDVEDSHKVWQGRDASGISTPVVHDGKMYVVNNKVLTSVDMTTGERISQSRIGSGSGGGAGRPQGGGGQRGGGQPGGGNRQGGGGRGGYGGGGRGGQDYSSPIVAGNNLYYAARSGDVYVYSLGEKVEQVAVNKFSDGGEYNATPAVSNGELFIRSTKALYCVKESK